jgi:hypothetical protein
MLGTDYSTVAAALAAPRAVAMVLPQFMGVLQARISLWVSLER